MKIKSLCVEGLHGSITKNVDFYPDVNLLVGINGSGKTSLLNAMDWIFRSNLPRLAVTDFRRLAVRFSVGRDQHELEVRHGAREMKIHHHADGAKDVDAPLSVRTRIPPRKIAEPQVFQGLLADYANLEPEKSERPLWTFLEQLPKPVVIRLDRTLSAESQDVEFLERAPELLRHRKQPVSAISNVVEVTARHHARYASKLLQLNDELKSRLVISAFSDSSTMPRNATRMTSEQVERLHRKVSELLSAAFKDEDVKAKVAAFFERVGKKVATGELSQQLHKIEELASAFNEYETRATIAYEQIGAYLDAVKAFFAESHKRVVFNDASALRFQYFDNKEQVPVQRLSSGERQILILLTFMAFSTEEDPVFIVDEPELSLHPQWQRDFVARAKAVAPRSAQFVYATHSPELVAHHRAACVEL
jgi:predicted ATP-dependent endonuclease of OLD family